MTSLKALACELARIDAVRLPGLGPGDLPKQWVETIAATVIGGIGFATFILLYRFPFSYMLSIFLVIVFFPVVAVML